MNEINTARILKLRDKVINTPYIHREEFYYYFFKKYTTLKDLSKEEMYGEAFKYAFCNIEVGIDEGELIVGKQIRPLNEAEAEEYEHLKQFAVNDFTVFEGQDSHRAIDYELVLTKGLSGIIDDINKKLEIVTEEEKIRFYKVCRACLEAVCIYSDRYSECAAKLAEKCSDSDRKKELEEIAKITAMVPKNPAKSFYEAVQAVSFITHCISYDPNRIHCAQQFQLGHPDRYLLPYYENDIKNGSLTEELAQVLLDCLALHINIRVHNGLSSGYMVGGHDKYGKVVANDLTRMCMQVIEDVNLVYPSVGFCYSEGYPEEYLEQACKILSHGHSHPAIFNDTVIQKGLMHYGIPAEEACEYIHSTCVEITPVSSSNAWVASPYTNMPKILVGIMDREYRSFDELLERYFDELAASIKHNFEDQHNSMQKRKKKCICPLLSCFTNDCLEKGIDVEQGGGRYNWIMPSFVGMANLVDSLYAIKTLIFENKELTFAEYKKAIDCNFEGYEELLLKITNKIDKYGNDNDDIDRYFNIIIEKIISECERHTPEMNNGKLIPSVFCWIMHEIFGKETGATPDGRRAGFPLGDGSGPCQGREKKGPTASVLSSTKWDHSKLIGGVAVNMKFSKKMFSDESLEKMKALINSYISRGGFEIQINVVNRETLEKAQKNPDEYKDLVVRIGGYSDYFTKLSPEMQAEVMLRTEHEI